MLQVLLFAMILLQLHLTNGQTPTVSAVLTPIQVIEGQTFQACFTLSRRPLGSDFVLSLDNTEESAFQPFGNTVLFADGTTQLQQCLNVPLAAVDNVFRSSKVISNVFEATTTYQGQTSTVLLGLLILTDSTVLTVGFEQTSYTFIEGESAQVCVSVDGIIDGSSIFREADFSFTAGSAMPFDDYQVGLDTVTFDSTTTNQRECLTLPIVVDGNTEEPETLTVQLTGAEAPLVINSARNRATITIIDIPTECSEVLLSPQNGTLVFSSGRDIGSTATYSCVDGFDLILGDEMRICQTNGQWSGIAPMCGRVDCGPLDPPTSGSLMFPSGTTTFGSVVVYTCDLGHELMGLGDGQSSRLCLATRMWSLSNPTCEPIDCGPNFGTLGNGTVDDEEGTTFGSQVEFTCNRGFTRLGNQFRECLANGSWSGSVPTCEVIECPDLTLILPPFTMVTIERIDPAQPGLLATYECIRGYETQDLILRFCDPMGSIEGVWSGQPPTCTIVNCGAPSPVTPGDVIFTDTVFGSIANYSCDVGHVLEPPDEASRLRECQDDGTWFGVDPSCELVRCGSLANPRNGVVLMTSMVFGSVATYSCSVGFVLSNEDNRTCGADGEWTGEDPLCEDINECSQGTDNCQEQATCVNTEGSFMCICIPGFSGAQCEDVDECLAETDNCHEGATCTNTVGSFECTCRDGFIGNGIICEELCTVQLVFDGIGDCNDWIMIDAPEKLDDIDGFVQSSIADDCGCAFTADNIMGGVFSCPDSLPPTAVVYRSEVRGIDSDGCGGLVNSLGMVIQSSPPPLVLGNELDLIQSCDVSVSSIGSEFACDISGEEGGGISIIVIAGAAGGGALLFLVLLVFCVVVLVVFRKKQRKKRIEAARSFVGTSNDERTLPLQPPEFAPAPNDHIYTTPNLYDVQNQAQVTSFSTNADVIPRLGTLKSQKQNYIDGTMDPEVQKPLPIPIPKPGEMQVEEFYDRVCKDGAGLSGETGEKVNRVYADGYDRPRSISTDLRDGEAPVSSSVKSTAESVSTFETMDEVEAINLFAGTTIPRALRGSSDMAVNPLYDPRIRNNNV